VETAAYFMVADGPDSEGMQAMLIKVSGGQS
jgi:hypothetical protein